VSRWIVGHIPAWLLLIGLAIVIAGGAMLIQNIVRRRLPVLTGDSHNDVTKFTYGFIGFFYSFFIGFLVSSMWGQINTADDNARAEGAAAVQLARDRTAFDSADSLRIGQALLAYEQSAIEEWNQFNGVHLPATDAALTRLSSTYQQVNATTESQKALLQKSYANLDALSQARTIRLLTAREDGGLTWPLWAVIFMTSVMVLGTAIVYGVEHPAMHYPMVAVVGLIVAANLFLILELSHPYLGAISSAADPLEEAVLVVTHPGR
jgi:hypothetical protein